MQGCEEKRRRGEKRRDGETEEEMRGERWTGTQLDVSAQGEEDVASLQVAVDDLVIMEILERL